MTDSSGTPRTDEIHDRWYTGKEPYADTLLEHARQLERELAALRSEGERYREALRKYGEHTHECKLERLHKQTTTQCTCGLDAALSSAPPSDSVRVPSTHVLVPREPTEAICRAGVKYIGDGGRESMMTRLQWAADCYRAMLAAAPQGDDTKEKVK